MPANLNMTIPPGSLRRASPDQQGFNKLLRDVSAGPRGNGRIDGFTMALGRRLQNKIIGGVKSIPKVRSATRREFSGHVM